MRPHSQLAFRDLPAISGQAAATVVALHGRDGGLDDLIPLAAALGPDVRIVAPGAARGVYRGVDVVAHTWYGGRLDRPEPASFGDSLAQLERFVHDVRGRAAEDEPALPWLLGHDQGAVLAISLAAIAPDLVAGVMAVRGCLPVFTDHNLLVPVPSDLPVLLVGDRDEDSPPAAAVEVTAARLAHMGARVTTAWVDGARALGPAVADQLRSWLAGRLAG